MADIMLHTSTNSGFTCISNTFIDDFMKDANGEYVKIYLYLLRCLNREDYDFSISQLADCLDHTEKDIMRAFTYWEKVGLLRLEYSEDNELTGICLVDVNGKKSFTSVNNSAAPYVAITATMPAVSNIPIPVPFKPSYTPDELDAFKEEDEVSDLIFATQTYLGRPLSTSDTNTLLFWYDGLHMSVDLIQYLIETCLDNGHTSFHYMDTVARNWTEDGITTVEDARKSSSAHTNTVYSIKKALGIGNRELVESELNYIDKWANTYMFSLDIILEACERTIAATNKPSFKYADSILSSWNKASVRTLDDIALLDQEFTKASVARLSEARLKAASNANTSARAKSNNKFLNFEQRQNYDFNALEKKLLGN
ncbi:DnaD and phage-associated domain-containing protein [Pseudobutyrivibrio sp. OR37]|uniref:DnaD domain protein n=1 Tax=Pseudobutyrivibrio sp. OR37 TaxID=1798186 RepID=UPI0008F2B2E3|nr:DnaD domain protein [Pseudobutyrivibrio sp. OR37]SFH93276.1 DnaD and phage-associated domain-containing protein [Pseudobutyrivibrio sp. OR37]